MINASAAFFAVSALIFPIITIVYGMAGSAGHSLATAGMVAAPLGLLLINSRPRRAPTLILPDYLFLAFVAASLVSSLRNFDPEDLKELALFGCSLSFYVAARFMPDPQSAGRATFWVSLSIVTMATAVSAWQLLSVAVTGNNKIGIMGLDHAATLFAFACGFLVISFVTSGRRAVSVFSICVCVLIFASMTISTIALVRLTTMAIVFLLGALVLTSFARPEFRSIRTLSIVIMMVTIAGMITGANLRRTAVLGSVAEVVSAADLATKEEWLSRQMSGRPAVPPSCLAETRMDLSVEIRTTLARDAFYFMPTAGWFGYGINSFQRMSCLRGFAPHNIFMQAIIELGWIAGIAIMWLVLWSLMSGIGGQINAASIFAMSGLMFASTLGLAHGSISGALVLFLFLGLFANLRASKGKKSLAP